MDLAAAAGDHTTRMSLLWAGWNSWRTRAGATQRYETDDDATAGSSRRVSPEHWTRSCHERQSGWHVQGYCID